MEIISASRVSTRLGNTATRFSFLTTDKRVAVALESREYHPSRGDIEIRTHARISNAATYRITPEHYILCAIHTCAHTHTRTYRRGQIRLYWHGRMCVTRRVCVEGEKTWQLDSPPGAHINQKLRFRPSPKHGRARNLDAPGVPEVISPRGEWVVHGIGN